MDDLIARIRAAIDDDERLAKATAYGSEQESGQWHIDGRYIFDAATGSRVSGDIEDLEHEAAHMAHHGPARVLRQVAAHRKILDEHEYAIWPMGGELCTVCREWPCTTIRAVAEAYGIEVSDV